MTSPGARLGLASPEGLSSISQAGAVVLQLSKRWQPSLNLLPALSTSSGSTLSTDTAQGTRGSQDAQSC